jgi:putative transposase
MKSGKYFLSILIEGDSMKTLDKPINKIIGIDLGIKTFIVDSKGNEYENIKTKRNNEKKLAKLHRQLSKKVKGSKNKEKARIKLARYYERLNNKKQEYLHSITNKLLNENQVIAMEDLNVKGMMQNHHLARAIQELSLYDFKSKLIYKSNWYDRYVVEVGRYFASSKLCSNCGYKNVNLTLKDRSWVCPICGMKHDRDKNAAINIENEGNKIFNNKIGFRLPEFTPVENGSVDDKGESPLKSTHSSKQEDKTKMHKFS